MSYGCVFSHAAPFVGSGKENGVEDFRKIGSLPGTMLRERGQSRQERMENTEVVFWVCVFTVQVEIT